MSTDLLFWFATHQVITGILGLSILVASVSAFGTLAVLGAGNISWCHARDRVRLGVIWLGVLVGGWVVFWSMFKANVTTFSLANDHMVMVPAKISKPVDGNVIAKANGRAYHLVVDPTIDDLGIKGLDDSLFAAFSPNFKSTSIELATKAHPAGSQQAYVVLSKPSPKLSPANQRKAQDSKWHISPQLQINKYEKTK